MPDQSRNLQGRLGMSTAWNLQGRLGMSTAWNLQGMSTARPAMPSPIAIAAQIGRQIKIRLCSDPIESPLNLTPSEIN